MDSLIGNIRNIKIYDSSLFHVEDTTRAYQEYLKKLSTLDPLKLKYFIQTLKNREIINNQETELEESFLLELFKLSQKKDSIDITMNLINQNNLTPTDIKKIHRVVIKGSSDDIEQNYDYRKDNNKWVGYFGTNGETRIDYLPPDYNEILELTDVVLNYLNEDVNSFENLFIKPLVAHAAIAYIQPFGNGNTRLARVLQHCKFCDNTNQIFKTNLDKPVLYLSKNYLLTREQYRGLIKNLVVNKDNDAWNKWFNYNLNMIDEQLYYIDKQLTQYMRHI